GAAAGALREHWPPARLLAGDLAEELCGRGFSPVRIAGLSTLPGHHRGTVVRAVGELLGTFTVDACAIAGQQDYGAPGRAGPHTDGVCCVLPGRLLGLTCYRAAEGGEELVLVDVHDLVPALEAADPVALAVLRRPVPFFDGRVLCREPVFRAAGHGPLIRYRPDLIMAGLARTRPAEAGRVRDALDGLNRRLRPRGPAVRVRPGRDEVVFMDNHRMLHARAARP
ncbi:TauD/TfdA family dioxygenase, partial [Streptomyces tendae]